MNRFGLLALVGAGAYLLWQSMQPARGLVVMFPDNTWSFFPHWNDTALDVALATPGARTFASIDGELVHEYRISRFMNGWLADNCPLQVLWGEGWLPGQVEVLQDAGLAPTCPVLVEHVA